MGTLSLGQAEMPARTSISANKSMWSPFTAVGALISKPRVQVDVHEHVENVPDVVAGDPVGLESFCKVFLTTAVIGGLVSHLIHPGSAPSAAVAPMISERIFEDREDEVFAGWLRIEVLKSFVGIGVVECPDVRAALTS